MANEFEAWYRGNDPQNARKGWDAYNRPFGERYERPPEYADVRGEAYHHFPERHDIAEDQEKQQNPQEKDRQDKSRQSRRARTARAGQTAVKSAVQSIAGTCVATVVGAVVLVSGYQAIEAEKSAQEAANAAPIVATVDWDWEDANDQVTVILKDDNGEVIKVLPAVVDLVTEDATCTKEGLKTFTATATDEESEQTYTDVRTEPVPALGHTFDEGTPISVGNGQSVIIYKCTHCDEKFTITTSVEEEDD